MAAGSSVNPLLELMLWRIVYQNGGCADSSQLNSVYGLINSPMGKIRNFLNRLKAVFQGADYFDEQVTKQPTQSQILRAEKLIEKMDNEPFDVFHGVKRPSLGPDDDTTDSNAVERIAMDD